jgi:hypothetical protein
MELAFSSWNDGADYFCSIGFHQDYENHFGIIWCKNCGMLISEEPWRNLIIQ